MKFNFHMQNAENTKYEATLLNALELKKIKRCKMMEHSIKSLNRI